MNDFSVKRGDLSPLYSEDIPTEEGNYYLAVLFGSDEYFETIAYCTGEQKYNEEHIAEPEYWLNDWNEPVEGVKAKAPSGMRRWLFGPKVPTLKEVYSL